MDYKELEDKIMSECFGTEFYTKKLMKALAEQIKYSDTIVATCNAYAENGDEVMLLCTHHYLYIATDHFMKSASVIKIKRDTIQSTVSTKRFFSKFIIFETAKKSYKFKLNKLISQNTFNNILSV